MNDNYVKICEELRKPNSLFGCVAPIAIAAAKVIEEIDAGLDPAYVLIHEDEGFVTLQNLCERLRGTIRIPINDGLGAVGSGEEPDNPKEFVRRFSGQPELYFRAARIIEEYYNSLNSPAKEP